ncbi:hypothetical protein [Lichenifustis flavocetrariae]|uniref:Uncharacterized protein n=1 Tax=Lichenifustis flavocetrariae TaxID=2949735 RepID=A0AA41Z373_9HYPH|nr:hypothetical protein [Lichenifustis flavocetrariae]MCW6508457.1 hypothetical protein [Lichenifustis flavocetrariae]
MNIVDLETFSTVHRWADDRMKIYIENPHVNYTATTSGRTINETLLRGAGSALYANNAESRIFFVHIASDHFLAHRGIRQGPLHLVTFMPAQFVRPMGDQWMPKDRHLRAAARRAGPAAEFDVRVLQAFTRQALHGIPFVGMVEAALFKERTGRWSHRDWVSWHAHVLTWGATREELRKAVRPLRRKHCSLRKNVSSVHIKYVSYEDLLRQTGYILKAPQKAMREVFLPEGFNSQTGEIRSAELRLKKDWLRTGDRVRMLDIMGERTLDHLLFGNDEGTVLARQIRSEALAPWRRWGPKYD